MFDMYFWVSVVLAPTLTGLLTHFLVKAGIKTVAIWSVSAVVITVVAWFIFSGADKRRPELIVDRPCSYDSLKVDCRPTEPGKCFFRAVGEVRGLAPKSQAWGYALINIRGEGMCVSSDAMRFHYSTTEGVRQWYIDVFLPQGVQEVQEGERFDLHLLVTKKPLVESLLGKCGIFQIEEDLGLSVLETPHVVVQHLSWRKK